MKRDEFIKIMELNNSPDEESVMLAKSLLETSDFYDLNKDIIELIIYKVGNIYRLYEMRKCKSFKRLVPLSIDDIKFSKDD